MEEAQRSSAATPHCLRLLEHLRELRDLNPDITEHRRQELQQLCDLCVPEDFPVVAQEVQRLMGLFSQSPVMRAGKEILNEYFSAISEAARQLADAGEISRDPAADSGAAGTFSKSLVLYGAGAGTALERFRVMSHSGIPVQLHYAADAFRRRVEVVDTVFAIGFGMLRRIDPEQFQRWCSDYIQSNQGELDPMVIRDMLRELSRVAIVDERIIQWLFNWCDDSALREHWPLVARFADRLLCRVVLRHWGELPVKSGLHGTLAHLRLLVQNSHMDDEHLLGWLSATLQNFGEGIERFIDLNQDGGVAADNDDGQWRRSLLLAELRNLASAYVFIMAACDQLLTAPDGAAKLAMAFLGIIGSGLEQWEEQVRLYSERVVRWAFLVDLREGRTPEGTIRRFTFGDDGACNRLLNELELVSRQFGSVARREVVVRKLAVYYASYRRSALLGMEVARRYRHLARMLHEDFLRHWLSEEDLRQLQSQGFIQELFTLVSRAKRFLDHRRALEMTVEEMLASEMEFVDEVRGRRLACLRQILAMASDG